MTAHGDPQLYGDHLDRLVPSVSVAALAEVEQVVAHWRAAGWPDLAIGAVVFLAADPARRLYAMQALRQVV